MKVYKGKSRHELEWKLIRQIFDRVSAPHVQLQPGLHRGKEPAELSAQVRCVSAGRHFVP